MKRFGQLVLLMITLCPFSQFNVRADSSAGSAASYLRAGVNARYLAMGNAGTATVNDSTAGIWNPGAINRTALSSLAAQTAIMGWNRSWNYLGFAYPVHQADGRDFGFGFSWVQFSGGNDLEKRSSNRPDPEELFSDQQNAIIISVANDFNTDIHFGINGKVLMHKLDDANANGFSWDMAVWHQASESIAWGLVIQDLNGYLKWAGNHQDKLPLVIRPGVSWEGLDQQLLIAADGGLQIDPRINGISRVDYHIGAEYWFYPAIAARLGINDNQFTAGAGWQFELGTFAAIRLDYAFAWERAQTAGHTHLLSLILNIKELQSGDFIR